MLACCGTAIDTAPAPQTQAAFTPLQVSYGASTAWTLEVTVNYLEVANIDTVTTPANVSTANAFTDGITLDGTFSACAAGARFPVGLAADASSLLPLRSVPLNQFHFHSPSEHTINGVHYPLEMHMVHKLFQASSTNTTIVPSNAPSPALAKAAVIGIMFAYECADARVDALAAF